MYIPKQAEDFLTGGTHVTIAKDGKNEEWFYMPFWFKKISNKGEFEKMSFDQLPEYLKRELERRRNDPMRNKSQYPLIDKK